MSKLYDVRTILTGLLAVAVAGCSVGSDANKAKRETTSYFIEVPADFISLTHGGKLPLKMHPAGILSLENSPVSSTLALTTRLRDKDGRLVGITSELEDFAVAGGGPVPKGAGPVWDTYWTLLIAGRGSLYLHEKESLGPTVARIFAQARERKQDWEGNHSESSTVGPLPGRQGEIIGGTGAFYGASGTFREIGTLKKFTRDGQIEAQIELRLELDPLKNIKPD